LYFQIKIYPHPISFIFCFVWTLATLQGDSAIARVLDVEIKSGQEKKKYKKRDDGNHDDHDDKRDKPKEKKKKKKIDKLSKLRTMNVNDKMAK
jgi:hypothetical protein